MCVAKTFKVTRFWKKIDDWISRQQNHKVKFCFVCLFGTRNSVWSQLRYSGPTQCWQCWPLASMAFLSNNKIFSAEKRYPSGIFSGNIQYNSSKKQWNALVCHDTLSGVGSKILPTAFCLSGSETQRLAVLNRTDLIFCWNKALSFCSTWIRMCTILQQNIYVVKISPRKPTSQAVSPADFISSS